MQIPIYLAISIICFINKCTYVHLFFNWRNWINIGEKNIEVSNSSLFATFELNNFIITYESINNYSLAINTREKGEWEVRDSRGREYTIKPLAILCLLVYASIFDLCQLFVWFFALRWIDDSFNFSEETHLI